MNCIFFPAFLKHLRLFSQSQLPLLISLLTHYAKLSAGQLTWRVAQA